MDIQLKKTPRQRLLKYLPYIVGGVLFAAFLLWLAFNSYTHTLRIDKRGLNIGEVTRARFNDYVSLDAQVQPLNVVQISPEEGGVVLEKLVEEGARVHKGDVLVRLANANLELEILNAESELAEKQNMLRNTQISMEQESLGNRNEKLQQDMDVERKKREFAQKRELYKEQLISREEYLQAEENYNLAVKKHNLIGKRLQQDAKYRRSQLDQMNDNLEAMRRNVVLVRERKSKLEVRSLIDGEVGTLDVEQGQSIAPGQKIGQISDLSNYKVTANVDEHYIDRVTPGLSANFTQNGQRYALRVRKVFPEVRDGRFKVDFVFEGKRPNNIRTGQTYYIDLQLGAAKQAVIIPKGTFFSVTGGQWIFVLDKDGRKAYRRNIRIGRQNPQYYEVLEGLEPGERVIVSGYESYKDNEILVLE